MSLNCPEKNKPMQLKISQVDKCDDFSSFTQRNSCGMLRCCFARITKEESLCQMPKFWRQNPKVLQRHFMSPRISRLDIALKWDTRGRNFQVNQAIRRKYWRDWPCTLQRWSYLRCRNTGGQSLNRYFPVWRCHWTRIYDSPACRKKHGRTL